MVADLLGDESLADVAVWADSYLDGNNQTSFWHYVDIPLDANGYDRDRDCPRQPAVRAGSRKDRWRDCAVDRILYSEDRLRDASLDRADRAVALKFLVHLVGDLHQPFHGLELQRGGNGIPVVLFGSPRCHYDDGTSFACNLHAVWDGELIAHRGLSDANYLARLDRLIVTNDLTRRAGGTPADWALESHDLAKAALVPAHGNVDEAYYQSQIAVVDTRLALGGLRLAAVLNEK
jgi:hypothetical protein